MKRLIILLLLLLSAQPYAADTITQFNITWTFDKELSADGTGDTYQTGTFVNGDHWVVGSVNIKKIDPNSFNVAGRIKNGAMVNPGCALDALVYKHGLDNDIGGNNTYVEALNVAFEVNESNPLTLTAGSSLFSFLSRASYHSYYTFDDAAILTVLSSAPDVNSFRPAYIGSDKSILFNETDLDYTKLKSLDRSLIATPADYTDGTTHLEALHQDVLDDPGDKDETVERWFERPWPDFRPDAGGRTYHPTKNMPDYGREIVIMTAQGAMYLNLDFTDAQKRILLIRYVQLGLDLYAISQATDGGEVWIANGAHMHGRKLPILVAAVVLDDPNMLAMFDKTGDYINEGGYSNGGLVDHPDKTHPSGGPGAHAPDYIHFQEDDQTFYVGAADIYTPPYPLNTGSGAIYDTEDGDGTVTVTNGSPTVEGSGTGWSGIANNTYRIHIRLGPEAVRGWDANDSTGLMPYVIQSSNDGTQELTLAENWKGDTTVGASYRIGKTPFFGHGWSGNKRDYVEYTKVDLGLPEWGHKHAFSPVTAGKDWFDDIPNEGDFGATYRGGKYWGTTALVVHIMGQKLLWNHDVFFDYVDRMKVSVLEDSPASAFNTEFDREAWAAFRNDYGPTWRASYSTAPCMQIMQMIYR